MRDLYLYYRYKTKKEGDNLVVDNNILPYEKKRLELARKLYSDNQTASWEALAHFLAGVGIGKNESDVAYAKEQLKVVKDRENKKQEGMKAFFNLTTVESGRKLAEEKSLASGYFRNFNGRLDKVNSLGGIKSLLVELMLRNEIINSFTGHRKERLTNLKKKSNEENRKVDLDAFYNAIQEGVDKVNTQSGANMLEMEKTSVTPGIRIILTENNASYSNKELRAIISALNKSLYKIAKSHGVNSPRFYYTLSGEEIAVNRYVMAPDEVKFSGILK